MTVAAAIKINSAVIIPPVSHEQMMSAAARAFGYEGGLQPINEGDLRNLADELSAQAQSRDEAFEAVRKRLCKLQRYSFLLHPKGGIIRVKDKSGAWIAFDETHELFDPVAVDAAVAEERAGKA